MQFRILALLLLLAAPAYGQTRSGGGPLTQGPLTEVEIDLGQPQGGVPRMDPAKTDNTNSAAMQAGVDAAKAVIARYTTNGAATPIVWLHVPPNQKGYQLNSTVFVDSPYIRVKSNGPATRLNMQPSSGFPALLFGIPRTSLTGSGAVPNLTYRPDAFGVLDSGAATAANRRWGTRLGGGFSGAFLFSNASAFSHGGMSQTLTTSATPDAWVESNKVTIEFIVQGPGGAAMPSGAIISQIGGVVPAPFKITTRASGGWTFSLGTQSARYATPTQADYTFTSPVLTGPHRVTIQVDLDNNLVTAYEAGASGNGVQLAVSNGGAVTPGVLLNQNNWYCWEGDATSGQEVIQYGNASLPAYEQYGYCVSRSILYANNGAGQPTVAHPQAAGSANQSYFTLVGNPAGGNFTFTYNGVTSAPVNAPVTSANLPAFQGQCDAVFGAGKVVASIFNGQNALVLNVANGFTFARSGTDSTGVTCNGAALTGQVIADRIRYFPVTNGQATISNPNFLGYLQLTEDPRAVPAPRHLTIVGGTYQAAGVNSQCILANSDQFGGGNAGLETSQLGNGVRDITITSASGYGSSISISGGVNNFVLERVNAVGSGVYAFNVLNQGANYTHYFRDCQFSATDAPLFFHWSVAHIDGVNFISPGRSTIKAAGMDLFLSRFNVQGYLNQSESFFQFYPTGYGGTVVIEKGTVDYEGGAVYHRNGVQMARNAGVSSRLTLRDMVWQLIGDVPVVELDDNGISSSLGTSFFTADNVLTLGSRSMLRVNGPGWRGEVANFSGSNVHVESLGTYGPPGVSVRDTSKRLPYRFGPVTGGVSTYVATPPRDGQFRDLVSVKDGTWGTAAPPTWGGANRAASDPAATLAGYSVDHESITATVGGQTASRGHLTIGGVQMLANQLFGRGPSYFGDPVSTLGADVTLVLNGLATVSLGTPTAGTFTIGYNASSTSAGTTAPIAYNASAAAVQSALQAVPTIGAGNVSVSGSAGGPYAITFAGTLASIGIPTGFTVSGAGLTGGAAAVTVPAPSTGSYTLTYGGQTTAAILLTDNENTIAARLGALSSVLVGNVSVAPVTTRTFRITFTNALDRMGAAMGLTATNSLAGGQVQLSGIPTGSGLPGIPSTWWLGLSTIPYTRGNGYQEPSALTGYARIPLPNNATNFPASASGVKSLGVAPAFNFTATSASPATALCLFDAPVGGNCVATLKLDAPLPLTAGSTPAVTSFAWRHTPVPGTLFGCTTDYAWGKVMDAAWGGTPVAIPAVYYAALTPSSVTRSTTSFTEPSGANYARVAYTNDLAHWRSTALSDQQAGDAENAQAFAFGVPSASWGTLLAMPLTDSPTAGAGNAWFYPYLSAPVTPVSGGAAPGVAAGALSIAVD